MLKNLPEQATNLLRIRPAAENDLDFILDGWLKSYRRSPYAGSVPNNLYFKVYSTAIQQLIDRGMQIDILESSKVDSKLGFVAYECSERLGVVIHYIYLKEEYRGEGFAQFLLGYIGIDPGKPFLYTFRTFYSKKFPTGLYKPSIARRKDLEPERKQTNAQKSQAKTASRGI